MARQMASPKLGMGSRSVLGLIPLVATFGTAWPAGAAPEQTVHLEYDAPDGCPSSNALVEALRARSNLRLAASGERAVEVSVEVRVEGSGYLGRLEIRELDGGQTARDVLGSDCADLVAALGLVAAVLLDTEAKGAATESSKAHAPATPVAPRGEVPANPEARPLAAAASRPALERDAGLAATDGLPLWLGFGAGLLVSTVMAPRSSLALAVDLELGFRREGYLSPVFDLGLLRGQAVDVSQPLGDASFQTTAVRISGCPVRWPAKGELDLRPCAGVQGGVLNVNGETETTSRGTSVLLFGGELFGRLDVRPADWLVGRLDGGLALPFSRDRFYFYRDLAESTAFRIPAVGYLAQLSVLARWE